MSITTHALGACLSVALVAPSVVSAAPVGARDQAPTAAISEAQARGVTAAAAPATATPTAQPAMVVVPPVIAAPTAGTVVLAQGTAINFRTMNTLSSKTTKLGERFELTVAEPVFVGDVMVVPSGARGVGEVTRVVKKGAFGRSGKLDTKLLYVTVGMQRVGLTGTSNKAGSGGTAGTVAVAVLAGVFSAFVTGKSAEYAPGTVMRAYVDGDTQFASAVTVPSVAQVAAPVAAPAAPGLTTVATPPR